MFLANQRQSAAVVLPVLLYLLVSVGFFLTFGFHSYHHTDHGFILGYSWRIFGGQIPYRDFIYMRPPGSLYLHSLWLWLPEGWAFPTSRLSFYLEMGLAGLLPALWVLRAGFVQSPARLSLLSVSFYLIAIHNFPVMPWYTVDAVFFASAGLTAFLASLSISQPRKVLLWRSLASVALFSAALCKQPFAVLPAVLGAYAVAEFVVRCTRASKGVGSSVLLLLGTLLPGLALLLGLAGYLALNGALADCIDQVTRTSAGRDLWRAGWNSYAHSRHAWLCLLGLALVVLPTAIGSVRRGRLHWIAGLAAPGLYLGVGWLALLWPQTGHGLFFILLGSLVGRLWQLARHHRRGRLSSEPLLRLAFHAGLLIVAWCASISWSVKAPILGLGASAVALDDLIPYEKRVWLRLVPAALLLAFVTVSTWKLNAEHPYRDLPLRKQTAALHEIFPRFGRLYSNPHCARRMTELARLIEDYATSPDRPFTVLTSYPLIHFLTGRQSPTKFDWYVQWEVWGFRKEHLADLKRLDGIVFVERPSWEEGGAPCTESDFAAASSRYFVQRVFKAGRLIVSSPSFCVIEIGRPLGRRRDGEAASARYRSAPELPGL